jgi:hypothetical protein
MSEFEAQALALLVELKGDVGDLKGEVGNLKGNSSRCNMRGETLDDHEDRIRKLEEHKTFGACKMAGLCTASSIGGFGLLKLAGWLWGAK